MELESLARSQRPILGPHRDSNNQIISKMNVPMTVFRYEAIGMQLAGAVALRFFLLG